MGTINFKTSDYITLGYKIRDSWDISHDPIFKNFILEEMYANGYDDSDFEWYSEMRINEYAESDYDEISSALDRQRFSFFDIKLENGYYEGFQLLISANYDPDFLTKDDRIDFLAEVSHIREFLNLCVDYGMLECHPWWCTTWERADTTRADIDRVCDRIKEEFERI